MSDDSTDAAASDQTGPIKADDWVEAIRLLEKLFATNEGCVSSLQLRRELDQRGIQNARDICVRLRFYDPESEQNGALPRPELRWHHEGRSFYSEAAFQRKIAETEAAAAINEIAATEESFLEVDDEDEQPRRQNRQEEARLVSYVLDGLENLYGSDFVPDRRHVSFDVHNVRAGSTFENVDAIAVHWRSEDVVELIAVEVKLAFTASSVQQANNYARFAHRVWLAVPVKSAPEDAGLELREADPRLFEYVTRVGIGLLGCRPRRGRSYSVFPLHWPRLNHPDDIERVEFIERHRSVFEEAGILQARRRELPKIR